MSRKVAIVAVTRKGVELGQRLAKSLPGSHLYVPAKFASEPEAGEYSFREPVTGVVRGIFSRYDSLVLVMAAGIAVRSIATELEDKRQDPAVVVVDEAGKFAVSLLSGHLGGANEMAGTVASVIGAQPVLTTASEVSGTIAIDLLGREFGWELENEANVTRVSAALVNGDGVGVYQDAGERTWQETLPENIHIFNSLDDLVSSGSAALVITDKLVGREHRAPLSRAVIYRPRSLVVGIGCNRGTGAAQIDEAVGQVFREQGLSLKSVRNIATITLKQDEEGLLEFARNHNLPVAYFEKGALRLKTGPSEPSEIVLKRVGTPGVCEPAALLSSGSTGLVVPKMKLGGVTVAVARVPFGENDRKGGGKLFLVGFGPGDPKHMTFRAREALAQSKVVIGYETYIKLIESFLFGKEVITSSMGGEVARMKKAVEMAEAGQTVSVVCSGDSGIYGMAGLVGEIAREKGGLAVAVEVIPGVTSLAFSAALLGAPLTGDFAAISLSDYLVRWEDIVRRLENAARSDFIIAIYNPRSKHREHQIDEVRRILLRYREKSTPVGIVTSAYRQGQQVTITDLEHMLDFDIGMFTTIIVGNSSTFTLREWMVTPRGYEAKYSLGDEA
jgi:cobalt-precorrin 5A hydrolase/precorrin-3B C17-methyltransferase